jgi:outer membrane protein insertion porin family
VLSTVDPYFTIDGVSRAIDLFYRTSRPFNSLGDEYQLTTPGMAVRFGVPFSEFDTVFFGVGWERTQIGTSAGIPNSYFLYREQFGNSHAWPLTLGWARDGRDSAAGAHARPLPARQPRASRSATCATCAPTCSTSSTGRCPRLTLGLNAEIGMGQGPGRQALPGVQELLRRWPGLGARVRAGLARRHRPHRRLHRRHAQASTSTPSCTSRCPARGNDKTCASSASPTPATSGARASRSRFATLRASAGVGLSWISPVGPLKLSWGVPVRVQPNDRIQEFQFQIGTAF